MCNTDLRLRKRTSHKERKREREREEKKIKKIHGGETSRGDEEEERKRGNVCQSAARRVASSGCLADKRVISELLVNIEHPDALSSVTLRIDEMSACRCANMSTRYMRVLLHALLSSIEIALPTPRYHLISATTAPDSPIFPIQELFFQMRPPPDGGGQNI